jgi:hypothetical protein
MQRQARAPKTQPFGAEAFEASNSTVLRWLGMAGFLINSRGTTLMVDPLLGGFDMPVMIEFPIAADDVLRLEAVLVTHSDNDHYSVPTCRDLAPVTPEYHSTQYVASLMKQEGFPTYGHDIGEHFGIGPVRVEVTPADHAWQNASPGQRRSFGAKSPMSFCAPEGSLFGVLSCAVVMIGFLSDRGRVACSRDEDRCQDSLAAAYCSSVTGSSQVVPSPLSVPSSMARWHIMLSAVPPCQCASPGGYTRCLLLAS